MSAVGSRPRRRRPKLAVWKFASCDGCQLTLVDCEDELLTVAGRVRIAHFLEASRAVVAGPYDVSLVEGSVTTPSDVERIHDVRAQSKFLVGRRCVEFEFDVAQGEDLIRMLAHLSDQVA